MEHWTEALVRLRACSDAVEWARDYNTLDGAWRACVRGDWMLWLAGRMAGPPGDDSRRPLVLAACACARIALPKWEARHPADNRPRAAIETAEAWAHGGDDAPTMADVRTSAAAAAYGATYGATDAAYATYAAGAADATYAAYTAYAATYAATYVAADVADAAAAAEERMGILLECADIVRKYYPGPPALPSFGEDE